MIIKLEVSTLIHNYEIGRISILGIPFIWAPMFIMKELRRIAGAALLVSGDKFVSSAHRWPEPVASLTSEVMRAVDTQL